METLYVKHGTHPIISWFLCYRLERCAAGRSAIPPFSAILPIAGMSVKALYSLSVYSLEKLSSCKTCYYQHCPGSQATVYCFGYQITCEWSLTLALFSAASMFGLYIKNEFKQEYSTQ